MASEANQVLHDADEPIVDENKSTSRVESDALASSSSDAAVKKVVNKITPQCLIIGRNRRSPKTIILLIMPPAGWVVGWSLSSLPCNIP
jgi:hypothetical protein